MTRSKYSGAVILRAIAAAALMTWATGASGDETPWSYYVTGNAENVHTATRGLLVLQGGGTDVDENYERMAEFGGGGDFVVLRASGADEYNDYIFERCNCDSVETIVFRDRAASYDPRVSEIIRNAEALFIAGGDQSRYVRYWQDTPVQEAIHYVAARPAPVGGTSAGMAIMGEIVYSAFGPASLTSTAALGDPWHEDVTLARDFLRLPYLDDVITDQHLQERDRIGRTVVLMARALADDRSDGVRAIAADRETALHIDVATGKARVFATADHETPYIYMMRTTARPAICKPETPLTIRGIDVRRLGPGDVFDVGNWTAEDGIAYQLHAEEGELSSSRDSIY